MADDKIHIQKFVEWANGEPSKIWGRVGVTLTILGLIFVVPALPLP